MQSKENTWSMGKVLIIAAIVGVIVCLALLWLMMFSTWSAIFWGLVIGVVVFIILMLNYGASLDDGDAGHGSSHAASAAPAPAPAPAPTPTPAPAASSSSAAVTPADSGAAEKAAKSAKNVVEVPPESTPVEDVAERAPQTYESAPDSGGDDLKKIKGIGPGLEKTLNEMGFYTFAQIAGWGPAEIAWVDARLKFKGRIVRDNWVDQAAGMK